MSLADAQCCNRNHLRFCYCNSVANAKEPGLLTQNALTIDAKAATFVSLESMWSDVLRASDAIASLVIRRGRTIATDAVV